MAKTFAQINTSLLRSKKMKNCDYREKWAYVTAHLSSLGGFSGLFHYPKMMWAQESGISLEEIDAVVANLTDADLIAYDHDEELLRIVGYHRQRPPENASRAISLMLDFTTLTPDHSPTGVMRLRGISEFVVAAVQRAQGWKPDSPDWRKFRDTLQPFMARLWQEYGDNFTEILRNEITYVGKPAQAEIHSLFPILEQVHRDTLTTWAGVASFKRSVAHTAETYRLDRQSGQERRLWVMCEAGGMVPNAERRSGTLRCSRVIQRWV